jgi:hypothetical protein
MEKENKNELAFDRMEKIIHENALFSTFIRKTVKHKYIEYTHAKWRNPEEIQQKYEKSQELLIEYCLRSIKNVRWAKIPHSPAWGVHMKHSYYASEEADVVRVETLSDGHYSISKHSFYIEKGLKTPTTKFRNQKKSVRLFLDKCVYMAFVVGEWRDDMKIIHIDGDQCNCRLNNLTVQDVPATHLLHEYVPIYKKKIKHLVSNTAWQFRINKQKAEDIVQDSYIAVCLLLRKSNEIYSDESFFKIWRAHIRFVTLDSFKSPARRVLPNALENEYLFPVEESGFEYRIPIYCYVKSDDAREVIKMIFEGYSITEIHRCLNQPEWAVYDLRRKGIAEIRETFRRRREIPDIYFES